MNIIQIRYRTLRTALTSKIYRTPYITKAGVRTDGLCPICPTHLTAPRPLDTVGHVLGGCLHPKMTALVISRHNQALMKIPRQVLQGSKGGFLTIMDATAASDLPDGVRFHRILLPSIPCCS